MSTGVETRVAETLAELHELELREPGTAVPYFLGVLGGMADAWPSLRVRDVVLQAAEQTNAFVRDRSLARLARRVIAATGCDPRIELEFGGVSMAACASCGEHRAVTTLSVDGETYARVCGDCAGLPA